MSDELVTRYIRDDTDGPNVDRLAVACLLEDLRLRGKDGLQVSGGDAHSHVAGGLQSQQKRLVQETHSAGRGKNREVLLV